jgi:hypothetical protein
MLDFELPFLSGSNSIKVALAETIEARKSGVLYETGSGELRLAHYDIMVAALGSGVTLLEELSEEVSDPVVRVEVVAFKGPEALIRAESKKFGFLEFAAQGVARLLSISEQYGGPFNTAPTGVRCKRAGKPASILPRDWYHYYPPHSLPLVVPHHCNVCGEPV